MTEVMMTVANKPFMLSVKMMNGIMMSAILLNVEARKLRQELIFFHQFQVEKISYTFSLANFEHKEFLHPLKSGKGRVPILI
jgi:hypothetical protein